MSFLQTRCCNNTEWYGMMRHHCKPFCQGSAKPVGPNCPRTAVQSTTAHADQLFSPPTHATAIHSLSHVRPLPCYVAPSKWVLVLDQYVCMSASLSVRSHITCQNFMTFSVMLPAAVGQSYSNKNSML